MGAPVSYKIVMEYIMGKCRKLSGFVNLYVVIIYNNKTEQRVSSIKLPMTSHLPTVFFRSV